MVPDLTEDNYELHLVTRHGMLGLPATSCPKGWSNLQIGRLPIRNRLFLAHTTVHQNFPAI
jgi:hypothetical protein